MGGANAVGGRAQRKATQGHALSVGGQAHQAKQPAGRQGAHHAGQRSKHRRQRGHAANLRGHAHRHRGRDGFGRQGHQHIPRQTQCPAQPDGAGCRCGAPCQRGQHQPPPACAQRGPALPQRPAQGHDGGAQQEVDELRARKVGGVRRAGGQQHPRQHRHREHHRVGPWGMPGAHGHRLCQHIHSQGRRQPEQRGRRQVDPEFNEVLHAHSPWAAKGAVPLP